MLAALALLSLTPRQAQAFDYLEHSFFTDYACYQVQLRAAAELSEPRTNKQLTERYLALALFCPTRWDKPYCANDYKQLESSINLLEGPPDKSHDFSVSLGDYAALPDHISRWGPVKNLPRAAKEGLVYQTLYWLTDEPGTAGGTIEDVAEDACETDGLAPWKTIRADIDKMLVRYGQTGPVAIPENLLTPLQRKRPPRGPRDPSAIYSFDNPHYLDLVLRNHHHFGTQAFGAWRGFHSAAVGVAARSCVDVLALTADELDDISEETRAYADIDWEDLSEETRAERGCALIQEHLRRRLVRWGERAPRALSAPVKAKLALLKGEPKDAAAALARAALLDRVASAVIALVLEGGGLHFLQDGLAGGHMRTIRDREALDTVRHDHDRDNREGVTALLRSEAGRFPFVAFGDSYLLGPSLPTRDPKRRCDWGEISSQRKPDPGVVVNCLIQHQRGLLTAASMATLMDWMLAGSSLDVVASPERAVERGEKKGLCARRPGLMRFVCQHLPSQMTAAAGHEEATLGVDPVFRQGMLPVPPPPFSYESLSIRIGLDLARFAPQVGAQLSFLQELDNLTHWMTSYRIGMFTTLGEEKLNQWFLDFSYSFHWRWSARFLIDAGPYVYMGLRGFDADDVSFFSGIGPAVGLTVLPEGWIKLPLEVSLNYRLPLNFFTSTSGFFGERVIDTQMLQIGIGLAVMH